MWEKFVLFAKYAIMCKAISIGERSLHEYQVWQSEMQNPLDLFDFAECSLEYIIERKISPADLVGVLGRIMKKDCLVQESLNRLVNTLYEFRVMGRLEKWFDVASDEIDILLAIIDKHIKEFAEARRIRAGISSADLLVLSIILAVDSSCSINPICSPCNSLYTKERKEKRCVRAYPSSPQALSDSVTSRLRKKIPNKNNQINGMLKNIMLVERQAYMAWPHAVCLNDSIDLSNGMQIGVSSVSNTLYWERGEQLPKEHLMVLTTLSDAEGLLVPSVDMRQEFVKKYISAIDKMVEKNMHIGVFPEYVLNDHMLDEIRKYFLHSRSKVYASQFTLLIAGSLRSPSNDNVLHIIDRDGTTIGEYYKIHPYEDSNHKMELLTNPGSVLSTIDIPGFGRLLPAICIDYLSADATDRLFTMMNPSMIITSSHNESFEHFFSKAEGYANGHHTVSLYCNHCEGNNSKILNQWYDKTVSSYLCVPGKSKSGNGLAPQILVSRVCPQCSQECHGVNCFTNYTLNLNELGKSDSIYYPDAKKHEFKLVYS